MIRMLLLCMALFAVASCAHRAPAVSSPAQDLTDAVARERFERVSGLSYALDIDLSENSSAYTGRQIIRFQLADAQKDLPLDFRGRVTALAVNGVAIAQPAAAGVFLTLPKEQLRAGANEVEIRFSQDYNKDGVGLHRFQDPEDKEAYLYTQFEPFDANRWAPFFDQPDLKAQLKLTVVAPARWEVISTTMPEKIQATSGGAKQWIFKATPKISTYLYSLHAGPYRIWTAQYKAIPLRLMARRSLAKYVNSKDWFKFTKQGLEFYERYFDYPYPFEKYDQIIVPEFTAGAMENVAAVTFTERLVKRGYATRAERQNMAGIILHEMAHMWFGDLVTMKWWNDLWLNETFATYMSALTVASNTEFRDTAWPEFFRDKIRAYREDQWVTTHPIEARIDSTSAAFANFDGITYGKGAAVMKQLAYHLSPEVFRNGIRAYFKTYAFQNTELAQFTGALADAAKTDLAPWSAAWLKTTGVETIRAEYACDGGRLRSVTLQVEPVSGANVRPQTLSIAVLKGNAKRKIAIAFRRRVEIAEPGTVLDDAALRAAPCPDLIAANGDDHGYILQAWTSQQFERVKPLIPAIEDELIRFQMWHGLWEMVRRGELAPQDYLDTALAALPAEPSNRVLDFVLATIGASTPTLRSALGYLPKATPAERATRQKFVERAETQLWNEAARSKADKDRRLIFLDAYIRVAETPAARERLGALMTEKGQVAGLDVDQDRRWAVLAQLCALGAENCPALIEAEKKRDGSDRGKKAALTADAARPDLSVKQSYFQAITMAEPKFSYDETRAILRKFLPEIQEQLKQGLEDEIYPFLQKEVARRPDHLQDLLTDYLQPGRCEEKAHQRLATFVANKKLGVIPERSLQVSVQEDARCLAITRKARDYGKPLR